MASADQNSQFLSPGNFDVTLVLDDQTRLYASKNALMNKCEFFKGLFSADFKEKDSKEVKIPDVSQSDMMFFLHMLFGRKKVLPLDSYSLSTLMSLADRFLCPSLKERINGHLANESMFRNLSPRAKLSLVRAADLYKGNSLYLLKTCIRLCANLSFDDVSVLNGQISSGAVKALDAVLNQAAQHIHTCSRPRPRQSVFSWPFRVPNPCSACRQGGKFREKLTYEVVKRFEIDQNMLKG